MENIHNLLRHFIELKYSMSTGTDEWIDIKSNFELEGDAIAGSAWSDHYIKIPKSKIVSYSSDLSKFLLELNEYNPKDTIEKEEKDIILQKVLIGQEIYSEILKIKS